MSKNTTMHRIAGAIAALAIGATIGLGYNWYNSKDSQDMPAIVQSMDVKEYDTIGPDNTIDAAVDDIFTPASQTMIPDALLASKPETVDAGEYNTPVPSNTIDAAVDADVYSDPAQTAEIAREDDSDSADTIIPAPEPAPIEPSAYDDDTYPLFEIITSTPDDVLTDVLTSPLDELSLPEATGACINDIFAPDYQMTISDKPIASEPETVAAATQDAATQPAGCFGETRVNFEYDSTNFVDDTAAMRTLEDFVQRMVQNDIRSAYLNGFASEEGRARYNQRLSGKRADRVANLMEDIATSRGYALEVLTSEDGETTVFGKTYEPNRTVVIRTAEGTNPNEDAARAAELASHSAGEIYPIPCGAAATPEATAEAQTESAVPDVVTIDSVVETPAPANTYAPAAPAHAKKAPAYTVQGDTLTLQTGASIQVIQPGQAATPKKSHVKSKTNQLPDETEQIVEPAIPTATTEPVAEIPAELIQEIGSLEDYAGVVQARVAQHTNLVQTIKNECGPGDTGNMLCNIRPYGTKCNDGNPRVPTEPGEVTACKNATTYAKHGNEIIAIDLAYLLKEITTLQNDLTSIKPAPQAVEDRIRNLEQLIKTLDKMTDSAAESLSGQSEPIASTSSYTGHAGKTDTGYVGKTEKQTVARHQAQEVGNINNSSVDLEHRAYNRPSYSGSGERFSAEDRQARRELAFEAYNSGTSVREIAEGLNVSRTTIYRDLRAYEQQTEKEYRLTA